MKDKIPDFNPYSLDPQDIGHNQVLTSTVMHAVSLQHLIKPLEAFSYQDRPIKMLDVGCGKGYSTLAYALLANTVGPKQANKFQMTGVDYHSHFMERASLNLEKYANYLTNGSVKFRRHDFLKEKFDHKFDLLTFGFEVSKDVLIKNQSCLELGAHILVPLSQVDENENLASLEQDFCLLKYSAPDQFDVVTQIMRTAFA